MKDIIFLVGPTAIGKTSTSLHLARLTNAEIVSCDSMQVYRDMDIGTQKPSQYQKKKVKHYMIDVVSPSRNFSVAEFRRRSLVHIKSIHKKGKGILFVGGTPLYMKVLVDGLFESPPADKKLRDALRKEEALKGKGFLFLLSFYSQL